MRFVLFALVLGSTAPSDGAEPRPDPLFGGMAHLEREAFIRLVLSRNPSVEAARQAWQAASQREPQAKALDDPVVSYALAPLSIGTSDARYGQIIQASQRLPFRGKLGLRGDVARAYAEAAHQDYEAVRLRLATTASLLFDDYFLVYRALEINDEHLRLLEDWQRIAIARYAAGRASQQDPIQAEVEAARLMHHRVVLSTAQRTIAAQMSALLHRGPEELLPPPPPELDLPEEEKLDLRELEKAAVSSRPELRAVAATLEAGATYVRLQEKELYPDFEASTAFNSMWGVSQHRWTIGLAVTLPLQRDRLHAQVAEAEALVKRDQSRRLELEDRIRAEVYTAYERLGEARHVVELYRNRLLPASGDQVQAALAGFETGQNSFLALIEAERNRRTIRLEYQAALSDFYRRRAELDQAVGRLPLGDLP